MVCHFQSFTIFPRLEPRLFEPAFDSLLFHEPRCRAREIPLLDLPRYFCPQA
jgi:hypothetical protein